MEPTTLDQARLARQRQLAKAKFQRERKDPLAYSPGLNLLSAIGRYHYLTVDQVMRLTGIRSETYINKWLQHLTAAGYTYNKNFIAESAYGRPHGVWSLLPKGRYALKERGEGAGIRIPTSNRRDPSWLKHVRDLNDVLIQFERLVKLRPDYIITGFRHDLELERVASKLVMPDGTSHHFVPDGWVAIEHNREEFCYCIEMDRGTEREAGRIWKEKIRSYVTFASRRKNDTSPYQQLFEREALTGVLTVIKSHHETDQRRLEHLVRWTEEELTALNRQKWAPLFRFSILHADEADPRSFFGSASWVTPFEHRKEPLFADVL